MERLFFDQLCIDDLLRAYPELKQKKQILDPCAGVGAFAQRIEQLTENKVDTYDIDENKVPFEQVKDYMKFRCSNKYDAIITHIPSSMATSAKPYGFTQLLDKALRDVKPGGLVCNFQKLLHLETKKRYELIYARYKPEKILIYCNRVKEFKDKKGNFTSSTIAYCWVVWRKDEKGFYSNKTTQVEWIY